MAEIAIIDTGICLNYFDNVKLLESNVNFADVNRISKDNIPDNVMTHGTICASIVKTYAPTAPLHSLNVFDKGISRIESIIASIRYCINKNIKIINMSFGTNSINNGADLENIVNLAIENGIIIIASVSKNAIVTYPAHYNNVISVGVKADLHLTENKIRINKAKASSIKIFACGVQKLYKNGRLTYITANEPSYATAVVTALVYNVLCDLKKEITCQKVLEILTDKELPNNSCR